MVLVWLGLLLGAAVPAWRQAVDQHREVQALESQLADLDQWTVAGLWLEKTLAPRQAVIDPQWERLFPPESAKGEFFLDLARVADRSGVDDFDLRELVPSDGPPIPDYGAGQAPPLTAYRVRARFAGEYAQVAEFLGGLKMIERAVSVHNLAIKPARGAVTVDLELDVYVSKSDPS
jgi:hypothetical protein